MTHPVQLSPGLSRRSLGRSLLTFLAGPFYSSGARAANAPLLEVDRFIEDLAAESAHRASVTYRADAAIVLLSVPVFRRAGVGSGSASLTEAVRADERFYSLRFSGASKPERAAGLDRMGMIREVALERSSILHEAAYFGVLTSSPDETLEEGRRSLRAANQWNEYTAIDGQSLGHTTRSAVTHFRLPVLARANQHIVAEARANFQTSRPPWRENTWVRARAGQATPTFLYTLMRAVRSPERVTDDWYVYSERSYRLRLEKYPDRAQGQRFADLGLVSRPDQVIEVRGRTREERTGRLTTFRLWMEGGRERALPLRIEFQPRAYLRLSFEVDPQASTTPLEEEL